MHKLFVFVVVIAAICGHAVAENGIADYATQVDKKLTEAFQRLQSISSSIPDKTREDIIRAFAAFSNMKEFETSRLQLVETFKKSISTKEEQQRGVVTVIGDLEMFVKQLNDILDTANHMKASSDIIIRGEQRIMSMLQDQPRAKEVIQALLFGTLGNTKEWCDFNTKHKLEYPIFPACVPSQQQPPPPPPTAEAKPIAKNSKPKPKSEL
jgi:hypothetical protein